MHFSKTYAQLLADLPPELSETAVQYRQLKRLINQLVSELALLGLGPTVLQDLLQTGVDAAAEGTLTDGPRAVYEFNDNNSGSIEPRLRLWVDPPPHDPLEADDEEAGNGLLRTLQRHVPPAVDAENKLEIVIPLASDAAFFQLLGTTLQALSDHLLTMQAQFVKTLRQLTVTVSDSARPVSYTSTSFRAHSALRSNAGGVRVSASSKSDLYAWREIFQLYVETEIFESVGDRNRQDHSVDECEKRLKQFTDQVAERGLSGADKLKLPRSRQALQSFLQLNRFILNVKKFELANAEATRKILKKHAKRTALPAPDADSPPARALLPLRDASLPRILVQELGTTLLPVIPSLDDYACLICTSIAFKPIRLACGHLFCVRCLVKMQKRGDAQCPMCRAPCVLRADRSNVDWALLNFMRDWFPQESTLKLQQNEREAAREDLEAMGLDPDARCVVA
ncbi:SPX domain-containing protein [Mycena metata]|uniref:SPX domain-containing protein n=1 Tax=Mycena metata TaxID=1033252 RepID=A0AAD7I224_9AGAR|nr:SPX domain-containing protein [Mycena metata]